MCNVRWANHFGPKAHGIEYGHHHLHLPYKALIIQYQASSASGKTKHCLSSTIGNEFVAMCIDTNLIVYLMHQSEVVLG